MKQSKFDDMDKKIKNALERKTEDIFISDNMLEGIKEKIYEKNTKFGGLNMKKKIIAISAACVLCLATATCIAASSRIESWVSHSYITDELNQFPTESQIEKNTGFVPKYVENLSDKYSFESANFSQSRGMDADKETVIEKTDVYFRYTDGTQDFENHDKSLFVVCEKIDKEFFIDDYLIDSSIKDKYDITEYNGIELGYSWFVSKFFPPSYEQKDVMNELTEEEKKLNDEGKLNIAYGSSEIETQKTQVLRWYDDGIGYELMASDCDLSKDEMIEMAKKIINK